MTRISDAARGGTDWTIPSLSGGGIDPVNASTRGGSGQFSNADHHIRDHANNNSESSPNPAAITRSTTRWTIAII